MPLRQLSHGWSRQTPQVYFKLRRGGTVLFCAGIQVVGSKGQACSSCPFGASKYGPKALGKTVEKGGSLEARPLDEVSLWLLQTRRIMTQNQTTPFPARCSEIIVCRWHSQVRAMLEIFY